jgi:hypothetical protein
MVDIATINNTNMTDGGYSSMVNLDGGGFLAAYYYCDLFFTNSEIRFVKYKPEPLASSYSYTAGTNFSGTIGLGDWQTPYNGYIQVVMSRVAGIITLNPAFAFGFLHPVGSSYYITEAVFNGSGDNNQSFRVRDAQTGKAQLYVSAVGVGIGGVTNGTQSLNVSGNVAATNFTGAADGLTNLHASALTGVVPEVNSAHSLTNVTITQGTLYGSTGQTNWTFTDTNGWHNTNSGTLGHADGASGNFTFSGSVIASNITASAGGVFTGNGSGLTNIPVAAIVPLFYTNYSKTAQTSTNWINSWTPTYNCLVEVGGNISVTTYSANTGFALFVQYTNAITGLPANKSMMSGNGAVGAFPSAVYSLYCASNNPISFNTFALTGFNCTYNVDAYIFVRAILP